METEQKILAIPQTHAGRPDEIIWHYDSKGRFSVNSAYLLELRSNQQQRPSTSNARLGEGNTLANQWRYIWKSCTPPKVRTFIWRACHEAIPTAANLAKRATGVAEICTFCKSGEETTVDILFHCSYARQVWAMSNSPCHILFPMEDFVKFWLQRVYSKVRWVDGDWFFTVCWGLWNNRCHMVMEGKRLSRLGVIHQARRVYEDYKLATECLRVQRTNISEVP
ncbi:UNVERIFIED_CONTAM: hypothetical protein Slati_2954800 [Sesamum latifolium]|uniref:Reverse transcriptase zinc-binding domain-containing protein n=1 Tax=Sesamum latifolium TaxID=2727402 RepID=A0AAW2VHQ9_9LAMI